MSKEKIISLCGQYPPGFEEVDILSNPDFIFSNDPTTILSDYLILMVTQYL